MIHVTSRTNATERRENMLNVNKLLGAIYARGYNKGNFTKAMGKSEGWLSYKLKHKNFTLAEANQIVAVLRLTAAEASEIFFGLKVA